MGRRTLLYIDLKYATKITLKIVFSENRTLIVIEIKLVLTLNL